MTQEQFKKAEMLVTESERLEKVLLVVKEDTANGRAWLNAVVNHFYLFDAQFAETIKQNITEHLNAKLCDVRKELADL